MPYQLSAVKASDGTKGVAIAVQPEVMEILPLLRMLKANCPDEYKEVWYEIQPVATNRIAGLNGDGGN